MLKRQNANLAHFHEAIKTLLNKKIVKYCSNQRICTKYSRELFYFLTISLLGNIFTLIFLCLTSILNTKTKYVLFVMTATGFLMPKGCSKMIIKMHHLELLHFFEVFTFVVNLSNTCRCLMMLKSSQCERCLLYFVV